MQDHHRALIYTMVLASVADGDMSNSELATITEIVQFLPVFEGIEIDEIEAAAGDVGDLLDDPDGIDKAITQIDGLLPEKLGETAYALAVEVVAADRKAGQEELRLLEILRDRLAIDRLAGAAIEREPEHATRRFEDTGFGDMK